MTKLIALLGLTLALLLATSAQAASFNAAKFARDAQADLTSAKSRKSGILGGACKVVSRTRVRCTVLSPAYTAYTGGGPRFRVDFSYVKGFLFRVAYTSDNIRIAAPTKCRYITYAGFARHCDT